MKVKTQSPKIRFLSNSFIQRIIEEAEEVLEKTGVLIESDACLEIVGNGGCRIDKPNSKAFIPKRLVEESLKLVPTSVKLYDRKGDLQANLTRKNIYFNPGSATTQVLDSELGKVRDAVTRDQINIVKLVENLDNMAIQSTTLFPQDVPIDIVTPFRYFLCLKYGTKPIYGGPCYGEGYQILKDLLIAIRGNEEKLKSKPLNIFVVVINPPLKWSRESCDFLLQIADSGTPVMISPGSAMGATAPITLAGALVQHLAELLSGVVIIQMISPGTPIVFGGASPATFDMRYGASCMSTIEVMLMSVAVKETASYLKVPTGEFSIGSEAKCLDSQSGLESGIGAVLGALAGINLITGSGLLNTVRTASLEKLAIDNEICGLARRLVQGVIPREECLAEDLFINGLHEGRHFLLSTTTKRWMKKEHYYPGPIIDRQLREAWELGGATTAEMRAKEEVKRILAIYKANTLDENVDRELMKIMTKNAKKFGLNKLPIV